ncbi:hypothetical protein ACFL0D_00310 [Thermoproteota archaeon]
MISYIKIYGPPHLEAITALEKIAVNLPETCIMDHAILNNVSKYIAEDIGGWFSSRGVIVPIERCTDIISKSGVSLGEYDFFFEWNEQPKMKQIVDLMEKIDEALTEVGCRYTIDTKRRSF